MPGQVNAMRSRKFTGITGISFSDKLGNSPARGNLRTGHVWLNRSLWPGLNFYQRMYVLFHEEGHIVLQTRSEQKADNYAFGKYALEGYSLSNSVKAMTGGLDVDGNPQHKARALQQYRRAINWDYYINGNKKIKPIKETDPMKIQELLDDTSYAQERDNDDVSFLGFGKKARARREAKKEKKHEQKLEKIAARAEGRAAVAEKGGGILSTLGKVAGNLLGKGGSDTGGDTRSTDAETDPDPEPTGSKKWIWIIVAIIVIAIIAYLIYRSKKK